MRRAFDTTLPRASISRTRSGLRRLSSPTSRSHRPHAAGLDLYSATSPYPPNYDDRCHMLDGAPCKAKNKKCQETKN